MDRRHKHFSFLCERSRILAIGYAKKHKTHTKAQKWYSEKECTIHSEFDCCGKCEKIPEKVYIVNVRVKADGTLGLSKPCPCCQEMLSDIGIKEVYYSKTNGEFGHVGL